MKGAVLTNSPDGLILGKQRTVLGIPAGSVEQMRIPADLIRKAQSDMDVYQSALPEANLQAAKQLGLQKMDILYLTENADKLGGRLLGGATSTTYRVVLDPDGKVVAPGVWEMFDAAQWDAFTRLGGKQVVVKEFGIGEGAENEELSRGEYANRLFLNSFQHDIATNNGWLVSDGERTWFVNEYVEGRSFMGQRFVDLGMMAGGATQAQTDLARADLVLLQNTFYGSADINLGGLFVKDGRLFIIDLPFSGSAVSADRLPTGLYGYQESVTRQTFIDAINSKLDYYEKNKDVLIQNFRTSMEQAGFQPSEVQARVDQVTRNFDGLRERVNAQIELVRTLGEPTPAELLPDSVNRAQGVATNALQLGKQEYVVALRDMLVTSKANAMEGIARSLAAYDLMQPDTSAAMTRLLVSQLKLNPVDTNALLTRVRDVSQSDPGVIKAVETARAALVPENPATSALREQVLARMVAAC
jgi:hypothetical protein